jgi:hypothetical protein
VSLNEPNGTLPPAPWVVLSWSGQWVSFSGSSCVSVVAGRFDFPGRRDEPPVLPPKDQTLHYTSDNS